MAAALARRLLRRHDDVVVESAGTLPGGAPATDEANEVMQSYGLDLSGHRSRNIKEVEGPPDLVLVMTRDHARAVVDRSPELFPKTFLLRDLARRVREHGPRLRNESLSDYLARISDGRGVADLTSFNREDDIADPIGKGMESYEKCAAELNNLVGKVAAALYP